MPKLNKESEAYALKQKADAKKLINPKAAELAAEIKKALGNRIPKLNKQPSAIANGGVDKIVKEVSEAITSTTPDHKKVALVTVLNKCGSRPTKEDLGAK